MVFSPRAIIEAQGCRILRPRNFIGFLHEFGLRKITLDRTESRNRVARPLGRLYPRFDQRADPADNAGQCIANQLSMFRGGPESLRCSSRGRKVGMVRRDYRLQRVRLAANRTAHQISKPGVIGSRCPDYQFVNDLRPLVGRAVFGGPQNRRDSEVVEITDGNLQGFPAGGVERDAPGVRRFSATKFAKLGVALAIKQTPQPRPRSEGARRLKSQYRIKSAGLVADPSEPVSPFVARGLDRDGKCGANRPHELTGEIAVVAPQSERFGTPSIAASDTCKVGERLKLFHCQIIRCIVTAVNGAAKPIPSTGLRAHFFASEVTPATRRAFQPGKGGSCPTRTL